MLKLNSHGTRKLILDISKTRFYSAAVPKRKLESETKKEPKRENESFMANIFRGNLVSKQVFPYPDVLTLEQKETTDSMLDPFQRFFSDVNNAARNDENSVIDDKTLDALWELGGMAIQVPSEYGGLGMNNTQYARLCQIVGANDLGLGITLGAHQSIGFKGILLYGTPEQKAKYLPKVASEQVYAAFALTEPSSGSDANSIRSRAVKTADNKYYILNGSKIWISNGGLADVMTVFAQTEQIDKKTGEKKDKVTAFIVERSFGGVTNGAPEKKMGIKASNTAEVYFEDVKIPIENVLGKEGEGFKVAVNILNSGRFGMGATLSGTMKKCIEIATAHANNRTQFGQKIKEFGTIQEKLVNMNILQYATESMAFMISQNMDSGSQDYHLETAISKVYASECAWYVADEAIQILGGMGFMKETGLERIMRDLRIFRIFEGTNEVLRLFVALSGVQYAGNHLKELQRALKNPSANLGFIFKEASRRATSTIGLGGVDLSAFVVPELQESAKKAASCIDLFGRTTEEVLMKYNKNIINEQIVLNHLANSAIDIYAMIATLSRSTRAAKLNLPTAEHELNLTKALANQATERVFQHLRKATSSQIQSENKLLSTIAKKICEQDGVHSTGVIDLN
ncbi:PREDICTED: very long-chain specific acyl-CoA dehydrogenase, mitochondrial [Drosophila arizonae]|uniref:Very long-chain specific acyl-CoA dehydrogenase, mitochondrial n=1 Tax=Drosophila arizonae TaxID=7263 RepID=A0ABM1PAE9_DROAR|nr:PREDICTED: very long-chain specific acyl-CoA dehydrogenase, mitochondrial [Drosophila arizonae]